MMEQTEIFEISELAKLEAKRMSSNQLQAKINDLTDSLWRMNEETAYLGLNESSKRYDEFQAEVTRYRAFKWEYDRRSDNAVLIDLKMIP